MKRRLRLVTMVFIGILLMIPKYISMAVDFGESEQFHHLQPYIIVLGAMVVIITILILVNHRKKS